MHTGHFNATQARLYSRDKSALKLSFGATGPRCYDSAWRQIDQTLQIECHLVEHSEDRVIDLKEGRQTGWSHFCCCSVDEHQGLELDARNTRNQRRNEKSE